MSYQDEFYLTPAEYYMNQCFELARKALGRTSPNPIVGAIVLDSLGNIVGKGFHQEAGKEHAEVIALREAGDKAKGGVLVVNLEPCCHHGKTPPCTDLIIKSGIKEVIFSNYDPNPLVSGKGEKILVENKINVISKVLEKEGSEVNQFFLKWISRKLPWVTIKQAQTLDGKVALRNNKSNWITGEFSRREVHCWRNVYDAVLVGASTVICDNPKLTVRVPGLESSRNPCRVVLDVELQTKIESNVFNNDAKVFLVTKKGHEKSKLNYYLSYGDWIDVLEVSETAQSKLLDLNEVLQELGKRNILSLFVECGPTLASELFLKGLADEYVLYIAPRLFGDIEAKPTVNFGILENIEKCIEFNVFEYKLIGNDLMVSLRPTLTF